MKAKLSRRFWFITGAFSVLACNEGPIDFDANRPERGPSEMLPKGQVTDGNFEGGNDAIPAARDDISTPDGEVVSCDGACRSYCEAANLQNPVNAGLCSSMWGVGKAGNPINEDEACRRLWVDTQGVYPTRSEISDKCLGRPYGEVVNELLATDAFIALQSRIWADRLRYDTTTVSVERIYDMDLIVQALYQGRISYDHFAAITSAHPILTRRHATEGDRAEALFWLFLGRPPFGQERSDVGRLYHLWSNDYYDHPGLGMRLPDAFIRYRCLDYLGEVDESTSGECTSVLFGFEQLILKPDARSFRTEDDVLTMWSGMLTASEWEKLQAPGRLLAGQWLFWEHAANTVIDQYLDYELATIAPEVGEQLVRYTLANDGDIRAMHYAVLTSYPYLQSAMGGNDVLDRFTYGPVKQADAEVWVDSLNHMTDTNLGRCDLLLNRPGDFLEAGTPAALALLAESEWNVNRDFSGVDGRYRDLVRTLGGCPDNSEGGRFKIVSVLTTANQLNYAGRICDPGKQEDNPQAAALSKLLPADISADTPVTPEIAQQIFEHQTSTFFARRPTATEAEQAAARGTECEATGCRAEQFARVACFATLSSSEMMFY